MAKKINEFMTPDPVVLPETATAVEAAKTMRDEAIGSVIVQRDGGICGIVTDRDIVVRVLAEGRDAAHARLGDICSQELATVEPDDDLGKAIRLMRDKAIRRVPVVDRGQPVGILTLGDLAAERDPESALGTISAAPPNC